MLLILCCSYMYLTSMLKFQHWSQDELAALAVGYCGADIKALCAEAALHALRRRSVPQSCFSLLLLATHIPITQLRYCSN
jgi:hypothetical protein